MGHFLVCMKVEGEGSADEDVEIKKVVRASSGIDAHQQALSLVWVENPEINAAKIWVWSAEASRLAA